MFQQDDSPRDSFDSWQPSAPPWSIPDVSDDSTDAPLSPLVRYAALAVIVLVLVAIPIGWYAIRSPGDRAAPHPSSSLSQTPTGVGAGSDATPSPTATGPTPTPTAVGPTPSPSRNKPSNSAPVYNTKNSGASLDTALDLRYENLESPRPGSQNDFVISVNGITTVNNARIVARNGEPSLQQCASALYGAGRSVPVSSLTVGAYFCIRTDEGRTARIQLTVADHYTGDDGMDKIRALQYDVIVWKFNGEA